MLQLVVYGRLGLLPAGGMGNGLVDSLRHALLPVASLSIHQLALSTRMMRSSMLEVIGSDFVRTARAKGVAPRRIVYLHALKNALIPFTTLTGLQIGWLFGEVVVVEAIFHWPGLGLYAVNGIVNLDYPAILGSALVITVAFVLVNVLVDLAYAWLDPRVRYETGS